jgi:hypothetical protein
MRNCTPEAIGMDLRGKCWKDLTESEKASLHPDTLDIMQKYPDARIVGKKPTL